MLKSFLSEKNNFSFLPLFTNGFWILAWHGGVVVVVAGGNIRVGVTPLVLNAVGVAVLGSKYPVQSTVTDKTVMVTSGDKW